MQDPVAENNLQLELAKLVFTDPLTGYTGEGAGDFNVSPVINIFESAVKAKSPS